MRFRVISSKLGMVIDEKHQNYRTASVGLDGSSRIEKRGVLGDVQDVDNNCELEIEILGKWYSAKSLKELARGRE